MKPSLTLETTWGSTLRAFCLGLVLLSFLPLLRAHQFGLFSYEILGATVEITGYPRDAIGTVEIPAVIAGLPVTSIDVWAFSGCTGLTSVIIPSSVTSIGGGNWGGAFEGCTGLTDINVEAGNPAYASDGGVLLNAARTVLIRLPEGKTGSYSIPSSVTSIGSSAFYRCTGLTSVSIPSSITSIGELAFWRCTGLTRVSIPSSVTSIGSSAFSRCTGLTSVTIPSSVTSFGYHAFYGCTGLTNVTLQQGLTTLGYAMFSGCTGLTSVTIPSSVTSIGYSAFSGCTSLTAIEVMSGGPVVNGNTLSIRFLAETDGLWCYAETSTDLIHWTTTGVTTSAPGPNGLRTASVPINVPQRFMRVVVIPRDPPPPPDPDPDGGAWV